MPNKPRKPVKAKRKNPVRDNAKVPQSIEDVLAALADSGTSVMKLASADAKQSHGRVPVPQTALEAVRLLSQQNRVIEDLEKKYEESEDRNAAQYKLINTLSEGINRLETTINSVVNQLGGISDAVRDRDDKIEKLESRCVELEKRYSGQQINVN